MGSIASRVPRGARLSRESFEARHKVNSWLLWLHVPVLVLLGLCGPTPRWESAAVPAAVALIGGFSLLPSDPKVKASITSVGLIATTFAAIELSGGMMAM